LTPKDLGASVHVLPVTPALDPPTLFRALYQRELGFVLRLLARLGVPQRLVEDAAQEVFTVVHKKLATFDPTTSSRAWVAAIATRVAADTRKRAHVRREDLVDAVPEGGAPFVATALAPEQTRLAARRLLQRALVGLSDVEREVVVLVELEGFRVAELSQLLSIAEGTLHSRLHEGRRKLATAVRAIEAGVEAP
jgi:RNA polymerase sigma-70 factor (ECF subfamily)